MTIYTTSEFRKDTAEIVNRVAYGRERVLVGRHGKPVAALIPVEDLELLEYLEDQVDARTLRKARKAVEREGAVPWPKVKADAGL